MPAYSATEVVLILTGVGTLIGTITTSIISIRNSGKIDRVVTQNAEIGAKVDGAATASTAKIDALHATVASLTATVADSKQTAALLAQSTAIAAPNDPPSL